MPKMFSLKMVKMVGRWPTFLVLLSDIKRKEQERHLFFHECLAQLQTVSAIVSNAVQVQTRSTDSLFGRHQGQFDTTLREHVMDVINFFKKRCLRIAEIFILKSIASSHMKLHKCDADILQKNTHFSFGCCLCLLHTKSMIAASFSTTTGCYDASTHALFGCMVNFFPMNVTRGKHTGWQKTDLNCQNETILVVSVWTVLVLARILLLISSLPAPIKLPKWIKAKTEKDGTNLCHVHASTILLAF